MKSTSKTALIATVAIVGAFSSGFASGPAFAQVQRGPFEFEFRYDAAELGSVEGAKNLLARLQSVVTAYCGDVPGLSPEDRFTANKCIKRTMRASVEKFGNSTVAQAFQTRADG